MPSIINEPYKCTCTVEQMYGLSKRPSLNQAETGLAHSTPDAHLLQFKPHCK